MISRAQIKHIRALHSRKGREEHQEFLAEGSKLVLEVIGSSLDIHAVYGAEDWVKAHEARLSHRKIAVEVISEEEMERITALSTPSPVLAVIGTPQQQVHEELLDHSLTLVLDGIQDPGNLGTIIRIADWFGIPQVICSPTTVELHNPKVIQSTMGSFLRVTVVYRELGPFLAMAKVRVFGTFLEGSDLYKMNLPAAGVIVIGGEAHGISPSLEKFIAHKLTIPLFALSEHRAGHADSLNAAVAAAVVCAEFRRQNHD